MSKAFLTHITVPSGATGTQVPQKGEIDTLLSAKEATANKDATGGYAGLTLFKINFKNALNTITSFFTNANTVARTYTFPDKNGTVAMTSDITGTNSGTNTGDQTLPTTLPASDVSAWAKAATKPTYTYTDVGAQVAGSYITGSGTCSGTNTGDQTNISGNAATATNATSADNIDGIAFKNAAISASFVVDTQETNGIGYSTGYTLFGQTDGGVYCSTYNATWQHQINGDFRTGQIAIRGKNSGTWQAWRVVLDDTNCASYTCGNTNSISSAVGGSYTWTGTQFFQSNFGATSGVLNSPPLQVYSTGNNSAFMSFHRAGYYAVNMGLDSDNVFRIGGWSALANRWQLDMSGNGTYAGGVTASGDIVRNNTTYGSISLTGTLPGYSANSYPTLSSSGSSLYFASNGVYSGYWTGADFYSRGTVNTIGAVNCGTDIFHDVNYGYGQVSLYSASVFQAMYSMGTAYRLGAGGTVGNLYGTCWSHPNAGGAAANLDSHGQIVLINGGFGSCMSYSIKASANVTAYSDERLKTNWKPLADNFVEKLANIRVGTYDRIDQSITQVGVSAQSLETLMPEAVITGNDEMRTKSVAYGNAALASAVMLAKEMVEMKSMIEELRAEIATLKGSK